MNLLPLTDSDFARLQQRLDRLAADAPGGALLSVSVDLGAGTHDWLHAQPASREFCYWARPDSGVFRLGLGRAVVCSSAGPARFTALQAAHAGIAGDWRHDSDIDNNSGDHGAHAPVACLGFAFEESAGGELPNAQLGVAAVLLTSAGGRGSATFTTAARDAAGAVARWRGLLAATPLPAAAPARSPGPAAGPLAERAWSARVQRALSAIAAGELDKVVLSRSLRLPLAGRIAPTALLARLVERHPESTVFAVASENAVFLGATPEQLVGFAGGAVRADALAGTAWDDEPLEVDKNAHEQALVVTAIRDALAPLCATLQLPPAPRVLELRGLHKLRHLWTPISGQVRPGIGLFDLIARLHPTPAVGGWPGEAARDWLRRHGERRPGWYGGGIGWIDRAGDGEVAVALRCGLIAGRHIELSAGAGIVAGSRAEHEFRETEAKLGTMLGVLCADPCATRTGTD
ncbi:MAG TPA: isochorismate synthase [Azospira sp.]|nr:isochorismate synthase [Azospira sp.]